MKGFKSRATAITFGLLLIVLFLAYAFWPRPLNVDIGAVTRGQMMVTIDEEAKTRVREAYMVSAPVTGRLLRIEVEPGDVVTGNESIIARMLPTNPTMLDVRTEEQAKASIEAAEAALAFAKAEAKRAAADADYATLEVTRMRKLYKQEAVSQAVLDRATRAWRAASAAQETAKAAVAMREADLERARTMLMTFSEAEKIALTTNPHPKDSIPIRTPISGRILRVLQESETIIAAGAPILEIGDPKGDLEIVAELLSTDAVKVTPGDRVIIEKWGGDVSLHGIIENVEPWGFTKFSALGVEEQRVNAIIKITDNPEARSRLGHGFRVEVKIITWEDENALKLASSAIFRSDGSWAVFKVTNGRARLTTIEPGYNNGVDAEVIKGLDEGDAVVLYPGNRIFDGARVKQRAINQ
ncbi:MAG: efflux RND transporter periplasmic adaptor subunit [Alphaproteobacteria bacterium]|nr:efflux RND transporter periplasmic adaptor subunit [Alphaproteobacteria bacterium]